MTDLVEFLRARLDEDESEINKHPDDPFDPDGYRATDQAGYAFPALTVGKQRALRQVERDRRIVEEHADDGGYCRTCAVEDRQENTLEEIRNDGPYMVTVHRPLLYPCPTLRLLALPYADHEDFRQEWRP